MPHMFSNDLRFRILGNKKILGKSQIWWRHCIVPSLRSRNYILAVAVKKQANVDIKLSFSFPFLLDFSIFFQIFCPGLPEQAKFCS